MGGGNTDVAEDQLLHLRKAAKRGKKGTDAGMEGLGRKKEGVVPFIPRGGRRCLRSATT